jgi:hypothetical protein
MSGPAIVFMAASWTLVLGLTGFCFYRILLHRRHHDPDGAGPAKPPERGSAAEE